MIKILYLHAGAELYGADIVMLELIKGIDKSKFEPYVILPENGPLVDKLKNENINVSIEKYPILRRKYFNLKGIIQYGYNFFKYSKKIVNFINNEKIDIVHINTSAVLEGCYIKKKTNVKVVWHIHEILLKPRFVATIINKSIAKYADEIICVSNAVKEYFEKITKRKKNIKVIYNGVDNKKFNNNVKTDYLKTEFKINDNELIVGMIGRINAWKGQKDFINAMDIVIKKRKNVKGLIVGGVYNGQEWRREELKKVISEKKLNEKIIMCDFRNDSPNIHNVIDIFVLPSTNPDPLPTVVLEAMATGKPIVAYKHGGVCEMVIENYNGFFAEVGNCEELANKIIEIVDNEEKRKRMGRNSENRQKELFSLNSFIKNFEKIYLEL